jgi:Fe-S cluster assembly protein SufD
MPVAEERDLFRASFDRFARRQEGHDPAWLREKRSQAMVRFAERGFPTRHDEAWRFTNVSALARGDFRPAPTVRDVPAMPELPGLFGPQAVFVNGRFSPERSSSLTQDGVLVSSLRDMLARDPGRLEPHLVGAASQATVFAELNTAFLEDGAVVSVAEDAVVAEPIHLVFLSTNSDAGPSGPIVAYPRVLVVAGRHSQSRVVESFAGPDGQVYFTNAVTEVVVGRDAILERYSLQREGESAYHVHATAARLERGARFTDHAFSLGAALARSDIGVLFDGEGGECSLNGLFLADGRRHTDTHTVIDHARPRCSSRELYKGIVDGAGRGVFDGLIVVRQDAQKTDSGQTNKNLLLSREALVHSIPRLEILADDVKCKHGSTTGQLDETALFYLRSRGISEAAARSLLVSAFASDVLSAGRIAPLRAILERHLASRLPGALDPREAVA